MGKTMVEIYTETDIFPRIFAPYCDLTTNGIITRTPEHGSRGDCNFRLAAGEECQPECDANYRVARNTSCSIDAQLTEGLCEPAVFFHTTVTIYINHVERGYFRSDIDPLPTGDLVYVNLTSGSGSDPEELYLGRLGAACNCLSYKGLIDEFRLWNAVVTETDLKFWADFHVSVYHSNYPSLIAYIEFPYDVGPDDGENAERRQLRRRWGVVPGRGRSDAASAERCLVGAQRV